MRSLLLLAFVLSLGSMSGVSAHAQPKTRGLAVVPDEERRSRIVEIIGQAQIPPQLRGQRGTSETELLRRQAVEAGRVAAHEKVLRETASSPGLELRSGPNGEDVSVLESRDVSGPQDRFQVWVRVEVRLYPKLLLAAPQPQAAPAPGSAAPTTPSSTIPSTAQDPLTVFIRTDRREYLEGEEMILTVRGNRDFYARITYEDAAGKIIQILPNAFRSDAKFSPDRDYRIPGEGDRFRLRVTPPFGQERFTVYASTSPIGHIAEPPQQRGAGLAETREARKQVAHRVRGLAVVQAPPMLAPAPGVVPVPSTATARPNAVDFYEAVWMVTTRPVVSPPSAPAEPPASARPPQPPRPPGGAAAQSPPSATAVPPVTADSRLPRECTPAFGRQLLSGINSLKPIRNSDIEVVDLIDFRMITVDSSGLNCRTTLLGSNGERVDTTIRIFISSLGEVLFELTPR